MANLEEFIPGKGPGTSRSQVMRALVFIVEEAHWRNRVSVADIMRHLDASEQFAKAVVQELISEGVVSYNTHETTSENRGMLDYHYSSTR